MDYKNKIKVIAQDKKVKHYELAEKIGISPNTLANKLSRTDNFNIKSLLIILDALDCELIIRDKSTGKIY